jgi:hypothetical protein
VAGHTASADTLNTREALVLSMMAKKPVPDVRLGALSAVVRLGAVNLSASMKSIKLLRIPCASTELRHIHQTLHCAFVLDADTTAVFSHPILMRAAVRSVDMINHGLLRLLMPPAKPLQSIGYKLILFTHWNPPWL